MIICGMRKQGHPARLTPSSTMAPDSMSERASAVRSPMRVRGTADFDSDGRPDLAFVSQVTAIFYQTELEFEPQPVRRSRQSPLIMPPAT